MPAEAHPSAHPTPSAAIQSARPSCRFERDHLAPRVPMFTPSLTCFDTSKTTQGSGVPPPQKKKEEQHKRVFLNMMNHEYPGGRAALDFPGKPGAALDRSSGASSCPPLTRRTSKPHASFAASAINLLTKDLKEA